MADVELKQEEYKPATFTLTTRTGAVADVSAAILTLTARKKDSAVISFTILDAAMDKTDADVGIVIITFISSDIATDGNYVMELKAVYSATHIVKSDDITLLVKRALDVLL